MSKARRSGRRKTRRHTAAHAIARARQRFGLELTVEDLAAIEHLIGHNKAEKLERQSNTRTLWRVEYLGQVVYVVCRKGLGVATFLTHEMVEKLRVGVGAPTPTCEQREAA